MARPLLILLSILVPALTLPAAAADTLVLKSGKKVKAAELEVADDAVRATLHVDGGTAVVRYRFDRLDPLHLLDLLESRWIAGQDAEADGAAALRIAAVARRFGLLDEAVVWFARAAEIDPALAAKRDTGLEAIRSARVTGALAVLADLLRAQRPGKLVEAADEMLAGELGLLLTPAEALRVSALRGLAAKLLAKADAAVAPGVPAAPAPAASPQPAPAGLDKALAKVLERVDAAMAKAQAARDKATDPGISNARARRLLETGAKSLLDARRAVREMAAPLPDVVIDRAIAIDAALVTTWLDVADLYREANRFQTARRFLRAARLLDPENERLREIELALEAPPPYEPPYEETTLDWLYYPAGYTLLGTGYPSRYWRYGSRHLRYGNLGFRCSRHYGCRIGGHGHRHHHGSHAHGSRRVVGRRR